jgi:hypothetical protein
MNLDEERRKTITYYIQAKPPTNGVFVHHSAYTSLKKIVQRHSLKEGKPYKGISLTTDPGRFLSALPMFGPTVDGFIEIPSQDLIDNYSRNEWRLFMAIQVLSNGVWQQVELVEICDDGCFTSEGYFPFTQVGLLW